MRRLAGLLCSMALFGLCQANLIAQEKKEEPAGKVKVVVVPPPSFKHLDCRKIVFVVDGAGGSTSAADNLSTVNSDQNLGLLIKPVSWSRQLSVKEDMLDQDAQLSAAWKIANWTRLIRKDAPNAEIYYMGHSAGARVVLAAAEMAGENSVDRVILLNAAVSQCYDLTTALKATRVGIDSFYATEDYVLERARDSVGMADGVKAEAGGRMGFGPIPKDELYCKLRQYRWNESLHGSGGHFTWVNHHNMKRVIAPLFLTH